MSKIVVADGMGILQKAFYGMPIRTANAVQGFLNVLSQLLDEEKPEYLTVVFGAGSQEQEREPVASLSEQISMLKERLASMGVHLIEREDHDTADIMGTLARLSHNAGLEVVLLSADRRLLQLVSPQIKVCIPVTKGAVRQLQVFDAAGVEEAFRITPEQMVDLMALAEVPGAGEKSVTELLNNYGLMENIYDHIDEILQKSIRESLLDGRELAEQNKSKLFIHTNAEIQTSYDQAGLDQMLVSGMRMAEGFETGAVQSAQVPRVNIEKDIKVRELTTLEAVTKAFDTALNHKHAAVRLINIKAESAGGLGAKADGQLFLQLEEQADSFGCMLCGGSDNATEVFLIEASNTVPKEEIMRRISTLLTAEQMSVSAFDVKNDYQSMVTEEIDRKLSSHEITRNVFDCKVAAYLLNPLKSDYSIPDVAGEYLNIMLSKWSDVFGKADFATAYRSQRQECLEYIAKETYILHIAQPILERSLAQSGMDKLFRNLEMPLTYVLSDMEREGILVKPEELKLYGEVLGEKIVSLEQKIHAEAGVDFNINSPKQLGEILFEKMQLPGGKKTKTGYSTAADVLEKLAPDYPIVSDILEYRGLTKLKSTYADGLAVYIDDDNKIHTNFNQTITATGRLSSTEPNLQNIPMRMELGRRIRKVFVPQEGCVFMDADYSQIELRVLAHMSDDKQLIEAYQMEQDIHRITASKVFNTPFEEVTDLQRRNAKAVNFGIVYGISSFGLSQDLSISPKEARTYIDEYFKTYPGIKSFLDKMVSDAKEKGYCETLFGRRRPVPELKSTNFNQRSFGERVAMNSPIQGTAADIIKYAMINVYDALKAEGLKSKLILQIHDELLVEVRQDEVDEVREILTREMQNACELAVKLEIDLHTGTDWYEAK